VKGRPLVLDSQELGESLGVGKLGVLLQVRMLGNDCVCPIMAHVDDSCTADRWLKGGDVSDCMWGRRRTRDVMYVT
jgi:hypothetical protein